MNARRRHYLRPSKRFIFNCTPQVPYSPMNVVTYITALGGLEIGAFNYMTVRHDSDPGEPCLNCGRVTREHHL